MSALKDFVAEQHMSDVAGMVVRKFSDTTHGEVTEDEHSFVENTIKVVMDKYAVIIDKGIVVQEEDVKNQIDEIMNKFVVSISGLMVSYVYSRLETYVLFKEFKRLKEELQDVR